MGDPDSPSDYGLERCRWEERKPSTPRAIMHYGTEKRFNALR